MNARRAAVVFVACIALLVGGLGAFVVFGSRGPSPAFSGVDVTGAPWGRDFALTDHRGRPRTLADFRGKVVALTFGYTQCPDMCPTTLAMLGDSVRRLGPDANRVQVLFATVDPARDTQDLLSRYVPAFHADFLGLHGDGAATQRAADEFKVYFRAQAPDTHGSYSVDHSGQVFVFDTQGRLRLYLKADASPPDAVARDLRRLLNEGKG